MRRRWRGNAGEPLTRGTEPIRFLAGARHAGRRLDAVVADLEAVASRAEAQRLIAAERVLVDGCARPKRHVLSVGERVDVRPAAPVHSPLTPQAVPLRILHRDEHLLVVDKPAGVVTHPARGHREGTLVHGLLAEAIAGGDDPTRPGIVHRLDRDTSGVLIVARSQVAHGRLQAMLRRREVDRRYLVLAHGALPPALTVDRPIARDRRRRVRMAIDAAGRPAITHLVRLEALCDLTLAEARLETGRTHQIRVHLEAVGHPVAGDPVYGRPAPGLDLRRQFLHSWRLAFAHPMSGEPVVVESPLPFDLERALERARGRGRAEPDRGRSR